MLPAWADYNSIPHGNTHTQTHTSLVCVHSIIAGILKLVLFSICLDFCLTRLGPESHTYTYYVSMCVFARLLNEISFWPYRKSIRLANLRNSLSLFLSAYYNNNYNVIVLRLCTYMPGNLMANLWQLLPHISRINWPLTLAVACEERFIKMCHIKIVKFPIHKRFATMRTQYTSIYSINALSCSLFKIDF